MSATDPGGTAVVSVVICAFTEERFDDLVAAIRSAQQQISPTREIITREIIVVIDHNEALLERLDREVSGITVIANTGRKGPSDARNCGVARTTGDIVAFLDDDVIADPDWLSKLIGPYQDPDVVGVGGFVAPRWDEERPSWFPPEFDWVIGCSYHGLPEVTAPIRNFIGGNMSFRREALVSSGGFDPTFRPSGANATGCEETELCIRVARESGGLLIHEPSARVSHHVPAKRTTWRYFTRRCRNEGRAKATVARLAGPDQALATERAYLRSVIPRRLATCLNPFSREDGGLAMAAAVMLGVMTTALAYVAATLVPRSLRDTVRPGSWRGWLGLGVIAGLWTATFQWTVRIGHMTGIGLVSVLPLVYWLAVGLLTISFWFWVRWRRAGPGLLGGHVVLLLAIVHATPAILYGTTRYSWTYKHVGIIDYIVTHHGVNGSMPNLTVYQDWPGFFGLNALFVQGSGVHSALSYTMWAPFVDELLLLAPLVLILRTFTTNRTLVWTAVWLFYLGNWIGQDYFSPQAFAYLLYLTVIAIILRWFLRLPPAARNRKAAARLGRPPPPLRVMSAGAAIEPAERRAAPGMYAAVVLLATAIAISHQLTPFMLSTALAGLLVTRRLRSWSLFLVVTGLGAGWVLTWGLPILHENLPAVLKTFGHPFDNTEAGFVNLNAASGSQQVVAFFDRGLTAVFCGLALLGAWSAWRSARWRRWQPAACLAVTPIFALFATSYGTEVAFRVFMFALPFLALFAASVLAPRPTGTARRKAVRWLVGLGVVSVLTASFFVSYDGKEQMNYMPPTEVAAMERLYALAPSGSLMIAATDNTPWAFAHYADYQYFWYLSGSPQTIKKIIRDPADKLDSLMSEYPHAYLIFSPTDAAAVKMQGLLKPGEYHAIERAARSSPKFRTVISEGGVVVLTRSVTS